MVEVICDTNFLIHLATRRIKNIDNLDMEIGSISFIVPEVVKNELTKLQQIPEKTQEITQTLNFIKKFKIIQINGIYADEELIKYVKNKRSIIGTMDKVLKNKIKKLDSSILSIHNDKIILES
ncbi:twitching motility protein PilT [Nitrosopumilus sp.]|nr:twitching motility protein PilT [Nitrosopumilus sp.]MDB4840408.1 twitching motility protein PilT [Nitrosopumilus sp.]MDC0155380.1 twitching motility protein PilT [Nitrosopumilus sp.]MDC0173587.1 twitching motility protein PilT [Nitrosopumilus sp.]MDC0218141.1 twitching motility protein PilT [Nitrosopumilus sp.]MDC0638968.1 twitching motility protein PilT [Nitrosopumilus sp.]